MAEGKSVNKKVMIALDDSEFSQYALEWTLQFLRDTISDSQLLLFTTVPIVDLSFVYASTYGAAPTDLIMTMQENQKKAGLALLEAAKEVCSKHGVVAETITEAGNPKDAICETVEKLNIDLLVLGTHGRGAVQRAFLGSVSNYCVHNAKCAVLVVRKPA